MAKAKIGEGITLDVSRLIETRMLIQSNSGGGKSWAVRKLLEETHGKVQQIVLDVEGEFGTLREKFDYILAGKGGDVDANPKTAELLARKVLELEVSLIVDLYELKKPDRIRFVKLFVDALVNSPKELWHPCLVVIDEAHVFAPEKGESDAAGAVIDLATRGRKRGFACVLATQRLSKLNKDVAAECLNKLIGRTSLDIDRKRAADELGFVTAGQSLSLRSLKPGDFFSFGPALHDEVVQGRIGSVCTTHPKAGQRLGFKRTRPTAHIKAVLRKLTDLPKEAEAELHDKAQLTNQVGLLKSEVRRLEAELRKAPAAVPATPDKGVVKRATQEAKAELLAYTVRELEGMTTRVRKQLNEVSLKPWLGRQELAKSAQVPPPKAVSAVTSSKIPQQLLVKGPTKLDTNSGGLGACERKILGFLAMKPNQTFTKVQVGAMTGYRHSSGGFNNALSKLTQAGLIQREHGGLIRLGDSEVQHLVDSTPHTLQDWIAKLGACERAIYQKVLETPNADWTKPALAEETGYSAGSGGFNNALSRLNTLGLIRREHGGTIRLNPEVQGL